MLVIRPESASLAPGGVTETSCPLVISLRVLRGNSKVTTALPAPTIVIVPALELSPTLNPTSPTVPEIGAVKLAQRDRPDSV